MHNALYTDEQKEQHIDDLYDWVMENKHAEMNFYHKGMMFKDSYEECVEAYIEDNADELWEEYIKETS